MELHAGVGHPALEGSGLGRAARNQTRLRVRQPLSRLLVRVPEERAGAAVQRHQDQILEELNIKSVELIARDAELVGYKIKPNLPRIGKRYGKLVPAIREALTTADGARIATAVAAGEAFEVAVGERRITFEAEDVLVETTSAEGYACAEEGGYLVGLDTRLTPALEREGLARELVRTVQEARKQAGLEVSDRIRLRVESEPKPSSQAVSCTATWGTCCSTCSRSISSRFRWTGTWDPSSSARCIWRDLF